MGRPATLVLAAVFLGGCSGEAAKSPEQAKADLLAPTDLKGLTPAQQRAVEGFAKANARGAKGP